MPRNDFQCRQGQQCRPCFRACQQSIMRRTIARAGSQHRSRRIGSDHTKRWCYDRADIEIVTSTTIGGPAKTASNDRLRPRQAPPRVPGESRANGTNT